MRPRSLQDLKDDALKTGGRWRIARSGELVYQRRGTSERAALRASILEARPETLVVAVDQTQEGGKVLARTARLEGRWSVDPRNRLTFEAARGRGPADLLTFAGGWELDRSHRLVFRCALNGRGRAAATATDFTFDGAWDLPGPRVLAYRLESGRTFSFRGSLQTPSILAKAGEVRWQLGAGATRGRRARALVFFGKWKLGRDLSLDFELERGRGRRRALRFGAAYGIGRGGELSLGLTARTGAPLGAELVLTRDFLRGDGRAFLRFRRDAEEALVEAGTALRW